MSRMLIGGLGVGIAFLIAGAAPAGAQADCLASGSGWQLGLSIDNQSPVLFESARDMLEGNWVNQSGERTFQPPAPIAPGVTTCGYATNGSGPNSPPFPVGGATWNAQGTSFSVLIRGSSRVTCGAISPITCELGSVTANPTKAYLTVKNITGDSSPPVITAKLPSTAGDDDLASSGPPLKLTSSEPGTARVQVIGEAGGNRHTVLRVRKRIERGGERYEISPRLPADDVRMASRLSLRIEVRDLAGNKRRIVRRLHIRH